MTSDRPDWHIIRDWRTPAIMKKHGTMPGNVAARPQGGDNLSVQLAFNFGTVCDAGTECKS